MKKKEKNKTSKPNRFKSYINRIITIIRMPEMSLLPGQLAFYILLSLIPLITLSCYIANLFELDYTKIVLTLDNLIPGGVGYIIPNIGTSGLSMPFIIMIGWMLYIASNGCNTVILISNDIYGIDQSTWLKRRIKALFMTILIVIFFIGLILLSIYEVKAEVVINSMENANIIMQYYGILKYPITFLLVYIFLRMFYNFAPDRLRVKKSHLNIGSILATIALCVVTIIYQSIANHMANYEMLYGGIANVALLMIWLYFISFIFVIGLALNCSEEIYEDNK